MSSNIRVLVWRATYRTSLPDDIASDLSEDDDSSSSDAPPSLLEDHLALNKTCLVDTQQRQRWIMTPYLYRAGCSVVECPSASKIRHSVLHPIHYRFGRLYEPVADLDRLAIVLSAPALWRLSVEHVKNLQSIMFALSSFMSEGSEAIAESRFSLLTGLVGNNLNRHVFVNGHLAFAIGGLLADPQLVVSGYTDNVFVTTEDCVVFATEMKTDASWTARAQWYGKSRCTQAKACLYQTGAPTLLLTPTKFKLFVLAEDGSEAIFPGGVEVASTRKFLIDVLVLLILSKANKFKPLETTSPVTPVKANEYELFTRPLEPTTEERLIRASRTHRLHKRNLDKDLESHEAIQDAVCGRDLVWRADLSKIIPIDDVGSSDMSDSE